MAKACLGSDDYVEQPAFSPRPMQFQEVSLCRSNSTPPNKPNFPLVVLLAGVTLIVVLVLAYFFIDFEGGHIHIRHRHANPNAQLLVPASLVRQQGIRDL
jgi:hypothetical protein